MENEETQVQEETVVQEESAVTEETTEEQSDEVTLPKSEFTKLKRKAIAYDATKEKKADAPTEKEDYISTVFMVKDLSQDEFASLKDEAKDLGVPFEKYLSSESGKTLLNKVRADKKSKDASEELTSKSPVYKKHSMEDLKQMSSKELEKILPK